PPCVPLSLHSFPTRRSSDLSGSFLELDAGESIGVGTVGADAEAVEEGASDQMRRIAAHRAYAEIDARLAKNHRPKLRMGIGDVQDRKSTRLNSSHSQISYAV